MTPERYRKIGGHLIEEFWWAGKPVVYVDNRASDKTYNEELAAHQEADRAKRREADDGDAEPDGGARYYGPDPDERT